ERDHPRADRGKRVGPRDDEILLRPGRELGAEQDGLQHQELNEESDHGPRFYGSSRVATVEWKRAAPKRRLPYGPRLSGRRRAQSLRRRRLIAQGARYAPAMLFNSYDYLIWFLPGTL